MRRRRLRFLLPVLFGAALSSVLLPGTLQAATGSLTTVGRDVVISQAHPGRVVAVLSDVRIAARVSGDVIVWGGDVSFAPGGSVAGDLLVFGGSIQAPPDRALPVEGRVATPGSLLRLYLSEVGRAPWEAGGTPVSISSGLHLLALAAWLAVGLVLLYAFPTPLSRAALSAEEDWSTALLAGALGVLTLFLTAAAALALLPSALAVPIALCCAAIAVIAKIFGMIALFLLVGQKLIRNVAPARRPRALAAGFALLGAVSFIPIVGALLWSAASIVAVGIALMSRFGAPRFRVAMA